MYQRLSSVQWNFLKDMAIKEQEVNIRDQIDLLVKQIERLKPEKGIDQNKILNNVCGQTKLGIDIVQINNDFSEDIELKINKEPRKEVLGLEDGASAIFEIMHAKQIQP